MENELTHWGIKGMRWGVRRYQNKDGTLTTAGKKRYAKEMAKLKEEERVAKNKQRTQAKLDKLDEKRREIEAIKSGKPTPKPAEKKSQKPSIKDMSDEELRAVVNRLNMEKMYRQLQPEQVSAGKKFANKVMNDVVAPAATEVGKNMLKDYMTKAVKKAAADAEKKKTT